MYDVELTENAEKQMRKLHRDDQEQIIGKLERSRIRPERYFERLVGDSSYKLRVGKYRIIADLEHKRLLILVIEIGHRRNIYNRK